MKKNILNLIELYLNEKYASPTAESYMYSIRRFIHKHPAPQKLKLSNIERYMADLKSMQHKVSYRNTTLAAIKAMFHCFVELELIKEHPCRTLHIDEKRSSGKDFSAFLTIQEMEQLLNLKEERFQFVSNRNKAMIGILIYQGTTSKELVEMKISDIDLDNGTVRINGQGKNKSRTLMLKPKQIAVLMRYLEIDRPKLIKVQTKKLFIGMRGVPFSTDALHEFIHGFTGAFDKEVSPMNIRSSVINHWLNVRNIPLEHVQVMAGHAYPSSTEKYIQNDFEEQREAITRLHASIFE